jgi:hypothetical protein
MKRPSRSRVRSEASSRGLRTSGTSAELSALNESADSGAGVPAARQSKQLYLAGVTSRYDQLLGSVTLAQLGQGFPEDSWQSVVRNGWATLPLHLLLADKRFLRVCLYANLADLGVSPERADTYESAQGDRSVAHCGSVRAQIARSGTDGRQAGSAERSRAVAAAI